MKVSPPVRFALAASVAVGRACASVIRRARRRAGKLRQGRRSRDAWADLDRRPGPAWREGGVRRYAEAQRRRRREGEGRPFQGRHLDADRQSRLVAIAGAGHHRHAEEIWRLGHRRRLRRISGRQADRGHRKHDPAASGRHHLDPGRFHGDGADLQEGVASGHQACVHGQHSDRARASEGICFDDLGRQPGQRPDRGCRSSPRASTRAARSGLSISASTISAPTSAPRAFASGCRRTAPTSK